MSPPTYLLADNFGATRVEQQIVDVLVDQFCGAMVALATENIIARAHDRRSTGTLFLQIVNLQSCLLRRPSQAPFDTLIHEWHECLVADLLPALL